MAEVWTLYVCSECGSHGFGWCTFHPRKLSGGRVEYHDREPVEVVPKAQADNLVKALRFYAEKDAWGPSDPHKGLPRVDLDEGDVARAALDAYETEDR